MMVNLCGPPTAGKSTHAKRFCKENLGFEYLVIDEFRMKYSEEDAWYNLMKSIVNCKKHCIVESSGLSWRISTILDHPTIKKNGILTIYLHGDEKTFHKRLNERQRTQSNTAPFKYKTLDEHSLITYCLDTFPIKYQSTEYIAVVSDDTVPQEKVYQTLRKVILDKIQ